MYKYRIIKRLHVENSYEPDSLTRQYLIQSMTEEYSREHWFTLFCFSSEQKAKEILEKIKKDKDKKVEGFDKMDFIIHIDEF